ncbi:hypothetical protein M3Y98_00310800 [Aphelenchoides besseyi]|nr:hypothetical protein M3Y98_00310800 [Aphelenchoides besseyi]KAI6201318.1 hypothetical protein M3Y96_00828900 [Aphelenchoides besseyi]
MSLPGASTSNNSKRGSRSSGRQTPASDSNDDDRDERMSTGSTVNTRRANRLSDFEKERSLEQSPRSFHNELKTDLSLVPVISDQLLRDWADGGFENANIGMLGKKALDLLCAKGVAEGRVEELNVRITQLEVLNKRMRETNVKMQARVEQEEEYISNMLLKRIQKLKSDKESIALKYEEEEENLTNTLSKKLFQLEKQRDELLNRISTQQSTTIDSLLLKVRKLEAEVRQNQKTLEQLRREKVDMENSLEHEQESLFNSLSKRVDHLEAEKRHLCEMLNVQGPESGSNSSNSSQQNEQRVSTSSNNVVSSMLNNEHSDGNEITSLRTQLTRARAMVLNLRQRNAELDKDRREKFAKFSDFERHPPTYEEFCQFVSDLNASKLNAAAPSATNSTENDASRNSPCHSESSLSASVHGSLSDFEKAGPSPLSMSSRDVSMDSDKFENPTTDSNSMN